MIEFILAPQNFPFTIALTVMLIIAFLEGVGAMLGAGLSSMMDQMLPEVDIDFDIEGPDLDMPSTLGKVLSWLRIGKVPALAVLVLFLLIFGVSGLLIQDLCSTSFGFLLPASLASVVALCVSIPMIKLSANTLSKVLPKDETSAVSRDSLIGRTATVTLGTAKKGYPTQAKVKDRFGKYHYIMLEPDDPEMTFQRGEVVLLVKHDGVRFYGIHPNNESFTKI